MRKPKRTLAVSVIMMDQVSNSIFNAPEASTPSVYVNISKGIHVRHEEDLCPISHAAIILPNGKAGANVQDVPPRQEKGMERQPAAGGGTGGTDLNPSMRDRAWLGLGKAAHLMKAAGQAGTGDDSGAIANHDGTAGSSTEKEELEDDYWQQFVGLDGPSQVSKLGGDSTRTGG